MQRKKLKIYKNNSPKLKIQCNFVKFITPNIINLANDMMKLMKESHGVGLAAPQVGQNQALFVMDHDGKTPKIVINPEIVHGEKKVISNEGCLSFPGVTVTMERFNKIQVRYFNEKSEAVYEVLEGFPAFVFQHEFQHLEGKTITDGVENVL